MEVCGYGVNNSGGFLGVRVRQGLRWRGAYGSLHGCLHCKVRENCSGIR